MPSSSDLGATKTASTKTIMKLIIIINVFMGNIRTSLPGNIDPETPRGCGNVQKWDFSAKFRGKTQISSITVKDGNSVRGAVAQNNAGSDSRYHI